MCLDGEGMKERLFYHSLRRCARDPGVLVSVSVEGVGV